MKIIRGLQTSSNVVEIAKRNIILNIVSSGYDWVLLRRNESMVTLKLLLMCVYVHGVLHLQPTNAGIGPSIPVTPKGIRLVWKMDEWMVDIFTRQY